MKNVLLIDPARAVRDTYSELVRQAGHGVYACKSAEEGLHFISEANKPDLVVVNIRQPNMTGIAFCEQVKNLCANVPIIAMSGPRDTTWLAEAGRVQVEAWLVQPAEPESFLNTIQAVLSR